MYAAYAMSMNATPELSLAAAAIGPRPGDLATINQGIRTNKVKNSFLLLGTITKAIKIPTIGANSKGFSEIK
jgi:hypothetical protein